MYTRERPPTVPLVSSRLALIPSTGGSVNLVLHFKGALECTSKEKPLLNGAVQETYKPFPRNGPPHSGKKTPLPLPLTLQPATAFLVSWGHFDFTSQILRSLALVHSSLETWKCSGRGLYEIQFPVRSRCVLRAPQPTLIRKGLDREERRGGSSVVSYRLVVCVYFCYR